MLAAVHPSPASGIALNGAFAAGHGVVTVGRVEDNSVSAIALNAAAPLDKRLPDKLVNMVSRRHARLEVVAGHLQLQDLGAVNGTYVNDQRMERMSRRVLQDNDVVSFGGPSTIAMSGQPRPNPWIWRIRQLHEFLASYVPPGRGPPAAAAPAGAPGGAAGAAGGRPVEAVRREVYSFSGGTPGARRMPGSAAAEAAAAAALLGSAAVEAAAAADEEEVAGPVGGEQEEEVHSPQPPPEGTSQPGSLLAQPAAGPESIPPPAAAEPAAGPLGSVPAAAAAAAAGPPSDDLPAAAQLAEDSSESAELAALAAYEAAMMSTAAAAQAGGYGSPPAVLATADAQQPLGTVMPAAEPPAAGLGPAPCQPLALQQQPAALQQAQAEVIDLTADSPVSCPRPRARGVWGAGRAADAVAPAAGSVPAEVVEVVDDVSPTKRRQDTSALAEQGAKRARPSPDAHLRHPAAPAAPEAAPAAVPQAADPSGTGGSATAAAAAAARGPDVSQMQQALELPVTTHALVPCGHTYCGECLAGWLATSKVECPNCRVKSSAPPVRQHGIDQVADLMAKTLPEEDRAARLEKQQAWEANREQLERQLAAPWQRGGGRGGGGGGGSGRGSSGGSDGTGRDGLLAALTASILGGGGLGGFGAADPLLMLGTLGEQAWHGGVGSSSDRRRRMPQVVPQHGRQQAPAQNEFRAEVSGPLSTARCAGCGSPVGELTTRIGVRPQGQGRGAAPPYRWYHLRCMPAAHWQEARRRGVAGLRSIPPPEQALVRERLRL